MIVAMLEDWKGSLAIVVPAGLGVVLGIGVLSNVLKVVLHRYAKTSHGVLLGLLLGSVFGLVPFQSAVHPELVTKDGVSPSRSGRFRPSRYVCDELAHFGPAG